ncbi:MAG: hypothetical protein MK096_00715 [Oleiphilaceae bacterium]|nr:hypothetical protein [Oleiphilaceae bacterium]
MLLDIKLSMKLLLLIFSFSALIGCESSVTTKEVPEYKEPLSFNQHKRWETLSGKWLGEHPLQGGGVMKWIIDRKADGTEKITFRTYRLNDQFHEEIEVGKWAISGPVYFTSFEGHVIQGNIIPANSSNPNNYDAYEILELNDSYFKYRHYEADITFTVKKVSDDFNFEEYKAL